MAETSRLIEISKEHGTPYFLFDLNVLTERIEKIQKDMGSDVTLCYAMKANPFLVDCLRKSSILFEVCSPGEFAICKRAGVQMNHIILSGVSKYEADVEDAILSGVEVLTVESEKHYRIIAEVSARLQKKVMVIFRLTSGNQFGMDTDVIEACLEKCVHEDYVEPIGLQLYSGTQKKTMRKIKKELEQLKSLLVELNEKFGLQMRKIEYGPGLPVEYFEDDCFNILHEEYEEVCGYMKELSGDWDVTLEMGRYIAATCGYYVTSVVDVKCNKEQNYCIIDGGINHINYFGQMMAMKKPDIEHVSMVNTEENVDKAYLICGSLCTTADVIVKDMHLNNLSEGDILVFKNIGAYSVTEGIYLFLSRMMPKILFLTQEDTVAVARDYYDTSLLNYTQQ